MQYMISLSLAFIALLASLYGIVYYYLNTRHKERMALIQAGLDPNTFNRASRLPTFLLMVGILLIGIAVAMAVGSLLQEISGYSYKQYPQFYMIVFPFFLGISLMICNSILKKINKKNHTK